MINVNNLFCALMDSLHDFGLENNLRTTFKMALRVYRKLNKIIQVKPRQ